jgi:lauroyl/myristoyl acyltransferase
MATRSIRYRVTLVIIRCLRALELFLPIDLLRMLLWPAAALNTAWELLGPERGARQFAQLPPSMRLPLPPATWARRLWLGRIEFNMTRYLWIIPDRLQLARWRRRCRCSGLERFEQICAAGRPVIVASVHFGPLVAMHYWLRSRGLEVAILAGTPLTCEDYIYGLTDRVTGLAGIPHALDVRQLKSVYQFLQPSRVLLIALDGRFGQPWRVPADDFCFLMAPGVVRFAARTNAVVIPCQVSADRPLGMTIYFGQPIPEAMVADRTQHPAACASLLRSFLPLLRAQPEQCSLELLARVVPPSEPQLDSPGSD